MKQVFYTLIFSSLALGIPVTQAQEITENTVTREQRTLTKTVKGRVMSASTGLPLAGAMVSAAQVEGYSTLTGEDGSYKIDVPQYVSALNMSAPGYHLARRGIVADGCMMDVRLYPSVTSRSDYEQETDITSPYSVKDFAYSPAVTIEEEIGRQLGAQVRTVGRSGTPGIGSAMFIGGLNSLYLQDLYWTICCYRNLDAMFHGHIAVQL